METGFPGERSGCLLPRTVLWRTYNLEFMNLGSHTALKSGFLAGSPDLGRPFTAQTAKSGRLPGERAAGEVARLALAQPCLIPDPPASSKAASRFHFQEKVCIFETVLGFVGSSQSFRSRGAVSVIPATTLLIIIFFFHTRKQLASALFDSGYSRLYYLNKTLCT